MWSHEPALIPSAPQLLVGVAASRSSTAIGASFGREPPKCDVEDTPNELRFRSHCSGCVDACAVRLRSGEGLPSANSGEVGERQCDETSRNLACILYCFRLTRRGIN